MGFFMLLRYLLVDETFLTFLIAINMKALQTMLKNSIIAGISMVIGKSLVL